MIERRDRRAADALRPLRFECDVLRWAEGSCRVVMGGTEVVCGASMEEKVPFWLRGSGRGWVTAEYGMLPRSTDERMRRESVSGGQGGRTHEIQRLIGRALRSVHTLELMGERMVRVDCDVINADGGTRCAAINGAYVAVALMWGDMVERGLIRKSPLRGLLGAVSCAVVGGAVLLDPDYREDSTASVDANFVLARVKDERGIVEVQMTAEGEPFSESVLAEMTALAGRGVAEIFAHQEAVLAEETKSKR